MQTLVQQKFLLISVVPQGMTDETVFQDMQELSSLVRTYGGQISEFLIQHRDKSDKGMFIGKGKIEEAAEIISKEKIDIVVMNSVLKSTQLFDFKTLWQKNNPKIEVWDRVDLILHIFSLHASTAEAKLQIELAQMRHMGPRIYGMGYVLSQQAGGIGTLGVGETNTELMRRHWRDQIKKTQEKLTKLSSEREQQLERRRKIGMQTISIVGYTNAGKTALFNTLCGKHKLTKNVLFATLDSAVGKMYLQELKQEIFLSDTIGFIQNLPLSLINAFKSTLMESIHADVLLHVIDASDPNMEKKIGVVETILQELKIENKNRIYVFNKMDVANIDEKDLQKQFAPFHPQCISVKNNSGIEELKSTIEQQLTVL
ncbi:MAG TPA: GTPase HflX [Patescibacteria group bacterium]|nr:GTPase HflX [Patescibacteria group bacterium]